MYRGWKKGYYQLVSDGWQEGKLFHRNDQFVYGMATIGLMHLKFGLRIYAFTLMPNHIHIVLCGTGNDCVEAFDYFRKRISTHLMKDGYPPLPPDYGFKLIPIKDEQEMRNHILYVLRNPYEKQWSTPLGYPWGSGWILFSKLAPFIKGEKVKDMPIRKVRACMGSLIDIPKDWEIHPSLGLLPGCFVETSQVYKLFKSVKNFETRLVKDYESYASVARELQENLLFSQEEVFDIVNLLLRKHFGNRTLQQLTINEKYSLAARLHQDFNIPSESIAHALVLQERIILQVLRSKEYGPRPDFHSFSSRRTHPQDVHEHDKGQ